MLFAVALAFIWGLVGWQKGSVFEVRGLLVTCFTLLAAMRLWHPVAEIFKADFGLDGGLSLFLGLVLPFFVARVLVSTALNNRAQTYKPAAENTSDKGIGAVAGFVSGLLMGSLLSLLVTVAFPEQAIADSPQVARKPIGRLPVAFFRFVENDLARVPENFRTKLPVVEIDRSNHAGLVWK